MKEKWRSRADKLSWLVPLIGLVDFLGQSYFRNIGWGSQNLGVSFGLFKNVEVTLLVLLWAGVGVILVNQIRKKEGYLSFLLITVGGGVNLLARIIWGGVWDYVQVPLINLWFNLSDVLITLGVILFILPQKHGD